MAIDFGLGLRTLQALGEESSRNQAIQLNAQQARIAQQRADQQAYAFDRLKVQDQARVGLANRARSGDFAGARQEAALAGDFDYANALGGLREDQLGEFQRQADTIGVLTPRLKAIPVEQRAAQAVPILKQVGFTDAQLAQMDWTDGGLDLAFEVSAAGKAALAARMKAAEGRVIGDGGALVDGNGNVLYENERAPKWQFDSESGSWLLPPDEGGAQFTRPAGGGTAPSAGAPVSGRTQFGWTPRARNGGDNSDAAVDGKLDGMSRFLRLDTDAPFPDSMTDIQIARALTLSEGGPGSIADRNNNPGNIRDPKTGAYRRFATKEDGLQAAAAQVRRNRARGQNTIREMVEGLPVGGAPQGSGGGARVVNVRAPKSDRRAPPSGYEWSADGTSLEAIRGGPADRNTATARNVESDRKAEAGFRKEFDGQPEVKVFKTARQQFNTLRDLVTKARPNGSDDLAIIFNFMKTLDPQSVVREGEFMQAANSAGFVEGVGNRFQRAADGRWLNPQQRQSMLRTAYANYKNYRDAYNQTAENFRGYARDSGVNPDRVARTYTPDPPQRTGPISAARLRQFRVTK